MTTRQKLMNSLMVTSCHMPIIFQRLRFVNMFTLWVTCIWICRWFYPVTTLHARTVYATFLPFTPMDCIKIAEYIGQCFTIYNGPAIILVFSYQTFVKSISPEMLNVYGVCEVQPICGCISEMIQNTSFVTVTH